MYPSSQASISLLVVPVLAAVGQLIAERVAVPLWTLSSRMLVSAPVPASLSAFTRWGVPQLLSTCPLGNTTFVIAIGVLRQPPSARVAYTTAISSGVTPSVRPPSASAG